MSNKNNCVVYKITNIINNRIYIGSSNNFKKRKSQHLRNLKKNIHNNVFLQRDFNKCGINSFKFELLLETDCKDLLFYFEQNYLDQYWDDCNKCYNIIKIASSPPSWKDKKHSKETKKKISIAHQGKKREPFTAEHKQNISKNNAKYWLGKKHSKETREKISELLRDGKHPWKGRYHTKETKERMSKNSPKYWKCKKHTDETKKKMSESKKGSKNYIFGKKHSEKTKKKISVSLKGKMIGNKNHMYDKHLPEETKLKISISKKGKCLGNENHFFGKEHSKETKNIMSILKKEIFKGNKNPRFDHIIYNFINEKLELKENCTRYELIKKYSLADSGVSLLISKKRKSYKGWKINN